MTTVRRRLTIGLIVLVLLLLGVGWYYSSQALVPGGVRTFDEPTVVLGGQPGDGRVTLLDLQDARLQAIGLLGLDDDSYGQLVGDVEAVGCPADEMISEATACVSRSWSQVLGAEPGHATAVALDPYFFPADQPELAVGTEVIDLDVTIGPDWPADENGNRGGIAPAWWIPPTTSDLVVVGIHGRGGNRAELLRLASIVVSRGHGMLIPTYRGDGVAPDPPDGLGRFGTQEWVDVAMAMLHPEVPDEARFVLAGYSQGGGLAAALLRSADVASRVDGLLLDSPLLGLDATMQVQAELAGIPSVLVRPVLESAYLVSRMRGFDFGEGEHVDFLAQSNVPVLLFHGPGDTFVSHEPSDSLAQLRADVMYVRIPGVDHVRFWNHDPVAYADAVDAFLDALPGGDA